MEELRYKLIGNDLYIAKKISLTEYEKKMLRIMETYKEVYMNDLVKTLRLPEVFIYQIIGKFNNKVNDIQILQFENRSKRFRLITKEEIDGLRR